MITQEYVAIQLTSMQVFILKQGLELEIRTWGGRKMQLTRESSLHAFTRLTGINPGRGIKGRQVALQILEQYEQACNEAEVTEE